MNQVNIIQAMNQIRKATSRSIQIVIEHLHQRWERRRSRNRNVNVTDITHFAILPNQNEKSEIQTTSDNNHSEKLRIQQAMELEWNRSLDNF